MSRSVKFLQVYKRTCAHVSKKVKRLTSKPCQQDSKTFLGKLVDCPCQVDVKTDKAIECIFVKQICHLWKIGTQ